MSADASIPREIRHVFHYLYSSSAVAAMDNHCVSTSRIG